MNILWQNEHYPDVTKGGGGSVNTFYIVRSMLAGGHNVIILSQGGDRRCISREDVNGTSVLRVPKPKLPSKLWPLWPLLESYSLKDLLIAHCRGYEGFVAIDAPYALAFKRLFPTRRLVYRIEATVRSHAVAVPRSAGDPSPSLQSVRLNAVKHVMTYENELIEQRAWQKSDALVVKSEFMRKELATLYKIGTEKVHVIPNGVDYERYAGAKTGTATLAQLNKNKTHKIVLVYCGRLVRMKNVSFLLQAFAKMRTKDDCVLVIIGDGEERANLEKQAASLAITEKVRFIGKTNRVEEFLAAADVFVFPSTYEPFGNALIEAMAAGLPCVVLKPDGVRIRTASAEIIRDGHSGYFVDPSPEAYATQVDRLVGDPTLRKTIGMQAQAVVRNRFDWTTCAAEYVRLLKNNTALDQQSTYGPE